MYEEEAQMEAPMPTRMVPAPLGANTVNGTSTQVGDALTSQPGLIDEIHKHLSELEARLFAVLRSDDEASDMEKEPMPMLVPLADQLFNHNLQLRRARNRLTSLLARLEL